VKIEEGFYNIVYCMKKNLVGYKDLQCHMSGLSSYYIVLLW